MTAKLLVPFGAFFQFNAGDTFSPLQPKLLDTNVSAIGFPLVKSGLLSSNLVANDADDTIAKVLAMMIFFNKIFPFTGKCDLSD